MYLPRKPITSLFPLPPITFHHAEDYPAYPRNSPALTTPPPSPTSLLSGGRSEIRFPSPYSVALWKTLGHKTRASQGLACCTVGNQNWFSNSTSVLRHQSLSSPIFGFGSNIFKKLNKDLLTIVWITKHDFGKLQSRILHWIMFNYNNYRWWL